MKSYISEYEKSIILVSICASPVALLDEIQFLEAKTWNSQKKQNQMNKNTGQSKDKIEQEKEINKI